MWAGSFSKEKCWKPFLEQQAFYTVVGRRKRLCNDAEMLLIKGRGGDLRSVGGVRNSAHNCRCFSPFLSFGVIIRVKGCASCIAGPAAPDWQSLCAWPRGAPFLCCHHISCPGASVRTNSALPPRRSRAVIEAMCGALAQGQPFIKAYPLCAGRQASSS